MSRGTGQKKRENDAQTNNCKKYSNINYKVNSK